MSWSTEPSRATTGSETDRVRHTVRLVLLAAIIAGAAQPAGAQTNSSTTPLTLPGALDRAIAASPAVAAARLRRPIDLASLAVAAERPNPELAYEISKETPRQSIGGTVPIELGGKRASRMALANATLSTGDAELDKVISDVRVAVRRAYYDLAAAAVRVQIADDVRALSQRARDAAAARVQAGDVPQSDLTQSDLALATSDSDVIGARGEVAAARAALNALLGQRPDTPLTLADALSDGTMMTADEALALATRSNADVRVLDRRIDEQTARIAVARSQTVPDIAAGSTFTYDAEPEFRFGWRISGGVTIPIFTRHRAGVVVEESTKAQLAAERAAVIARIEGAVASAIARATAAREQLARYQTSILPLALDAERQAQAAYDGGQIGLPALVQSLQVARETRQRGLQAALDYQRAIADLEEAIGATAK
jgi:outer membrane protein, heavy metal efflux system